jgi:hypothetical protein
MTLRECSENAIVKIERSDAKDWVPVTLERGLSCTLSPWTTYEKELDNVHLSLRGWLANAPRNYTFICTNLTWDQVDQDVNGRYIRNLTLVEELKSSLAKFVASLSNFDSDSEKLKSIIVLRITSPPQSSLSLAQIIVSLLTQTSSGFQGRRSSILPKNISCEMESRIISARGFEYSKPATRPKKQIEVKVSTVNPGVEFNQMVFPSY